MIYFIHLMYFFYVSDEWFVKLNDLFNSSHVFFYVSDEWLVKPHDLFHSSHVFLLCFR